MVALADLLDREDRACRGADPDLFFNETPGRFGHVEAAAICALCPIRRKCLEYALERPHLHGYWGGASADDRALMRRNPELVA